MTDFEIYLAKCRAESMKRKPLTREEKQGAYAVLIAIGMLLIVTALFGH